MKIILTIFLVLVLASACSKGGDSVAQKSAGKSAETPAANMEKPAVDDSMKDLKLPPGLDLQKGDAYDSNESAGALPEGSGSGVEDHPNLASTEKVERNIVVPDVVKGKWKAVKLQIRNKVNDKASELKTVDLGSVFNLESGNTRLKVTVGPFLPNFVMSQTSYTSINNAVTNPALQLTVEENGKVIYKGWAFAKYPTLYAFEHSVYSFQLMDFIPIT